MSTTDAQLRLFLLRRLPAEEAARLEELILLEDGFAERLRDEEFGLIDDYAASRLSAEDAADVARHLLASEETRHSLRVAHALQSVGGHARSQAEVPDSATSRAPSPATNPATFAVPRRRQRAQVWRVGMLLAACLAVVAYIPRWNASRHPESVEVAQDTAELPIISLLADVNRGPPPSLAIKAGAVALRLQAEVPDPTPGSRYSLVIQDAAGRQLFAAPTLELHTAGRYQFVETVVPADALGRGERTISVMGPGNATEADTKFTWRVTSVIE